MHGLDDMPLGLRYTDCITKFEVKEGPMAEAKYRGENLSSAATSESAVDPREAARQRRAAALKVAEGLWKDRTDIPKDGVQAQEQLRAEWH